MKAYLRKDGRYECRIQRTINGEKNKWSFYGHSPEEAVKKCRIFRDELLNSPIEPSRFTDAITISLLVEEWFNQKVLVHKESTKANYRTKASKHIIPAFDGISIYDITHRDVNKFARKLIDKGLSVNYVRSILVLLKSILIYGVRAYNIGINLDLVELPSKQYREKDIYTSDERASLFRYAATIGTVTAIATILAIGFGLRIGEVCGLKWSDFDFDGKILHIRRTVQRIACHDDERKTKIICTEPKSKSSIRDLVIPDLLYTVLMKFKSDGNIFIASGTDKYIEPRLLQSRFKALIKETGLRYLSFHSLRHGMATFCFEQGMDDIVISKILGHKSVEITRSIYIHSGLEQQRKQAHLMDIPAEYIA